MRRAAAAARPTNTLTLVSWNIALDSGDVVRLARTLESAAPASPVILLLQEAFRSGDDIPQSARGSASARMLGRSSSDREIDDVAKALGMSLYYVPSMRNGAPADVRQGRGNAISSTLPIEDFVAIELPFERQRRVAIGATVRGTTHDGRPWALRVVSVHLDNRGGGRRLGVGAEFGRVRQARGLREAIRGEEPIVIAGDFNTWFGFSDQASLETLFGYPETRVADRRRTFRGLFRLDHVFYRGGSGMASRRPAWRNGVRIRPPPFDHDRDVLGGRSCPRRRR